MNNHNISKKDKFQDRMVIKIKDNHLHKEESQERQNFNLVFHWTWKSIKKKV
jgi:hypothetical protein